MSRLKWRKHSYDGNEESEDEASVADDSDAIEEEEDEADADAGGVSADLSDSAPTKSALQERGMAPKRVVRTPSHYVLAGLKRIQSDGRRRGVSVRSIETLPIEESCSGAVQDWLEMQERAFGDAGFGPSSSVFIDCGDHGEIGETSGSSIAW